MGKSAENKIPVGFWNHRTSFIIAFCFHFKNSSDLLSRVQHPSLSRFFLAQISRSWRILLFWKMLSHGYYSYKRVLFAQNINSNSLMGKVSCGFPKCKKPHDMTTTQTKNSSFFYEKIGFYHHSTLFFFWAPFEVSLDPLGLPYQRSNAVSGRWLHPPTEAANRRRTWKNWTMIISDLPTNLPWIYRWNGGKYTMEHLVFMTYIGITKLTLHWKREIWSCMEGMAKVGSFLTAHLDWFRDHDGWNCAVIMFSDQNSGLLVEIPIEKTPPIISAPWGFDDPPRSYRCLSMPFNLELYTLDLILWTNRMCIRILVLIDLNPRVFHQSRSESWMQLWNPPGPSVNLFH